MTSRLQVQPVGPAMPGVRSMADSARVMLACRQDDEAVIRALCRVGCKCAIAGLDIQMCMSGEMGIVREAIFASVGLWGSRTRPLW